MLFELRHVYFLHWILVQLDIFFDDMLPFRVGLCLFLTIPLSFLPALFRSWSCLFFQSYNTCWLKHLWFTMFERFEVFHCLSVFAISKCWALNFWLDWGLGCSLGIHLQASSILRMHENIWIISKTILINEFIIFLWQNNLTLLPCCMAMLHLALQI